MFARMLDEFTPLMRLQDEMNRLFDSFVEESPAQRGYAAGYPGINLWEEGDNAYVEAELPGFSMEDVEVLVTGDQLTINGQRKATDRSNASYHRRERGTGRFSRALTLPWQVDADKVQAKLVDGVLTVTLPKSDLAKPKKIKLLGA
jgi:HSP20 family protein